MKKSIIILSVLPLVLWGSLAGAEINPSSQVDLPEAEGRVPAAYSSGKGFPKKSAGPFSAEGFGEEVPNPEKLRKPAQEEKVDENKSSEAESTSEDQIAEKTPEDGDSAVVSTPEESIENTENGKKEDKKKELSEEEKSLAEQLQLQRRVDVFYEGRVRFKNGASIWAVEDAGFSTPKLEVRGPDRMDNSEQELSFRVYTNYFPYIKNWELIIYKQEKLKSDSIFKKVEGEGESLFDIEVPISEGELAIGQTLYYVLKVYNEKGVFDLTKVKRIDVEPQREAGGSVQADKNSEARSIEEIWGQNSLEKQNIPLRGSRVRIVGANIPRNYDLAYRGQTINVDEQGKFVVEEHFPIGEHSIRLRISDRDNSEAFYVPFKMQVTGKYLFMVALADFRVGKGYLSEKVTGLSSDDYYSGDMFLDGRLAFYAKGKVKGKYLITAQLDTTEGDVEEVFKGIHRKNSEALFRRLDPDRYYPVYGDDSNTFEDSPSQGRLYVKVEVDQSYLLWGNYNSGIDGTLFAQYNRSLYGAKLEYNSNRSTKFGENKTKIKAFVSEPQTLFGHNEFLGTGGRVYTLRHNDVVIGSEKLVVEVRDRDSGLLISKVPLSPGRDYEFDYLAGRIVLSQALTTFVLTNSDEIIDSEGTDNDEYFLVADYEYNDNVTALSDSSYGGRVEKWLGSYFSVGGTYVDEKRDSTDYSLKGLDAQVRLGQESFIRIEGAESESRQTQANFISTNGGLTFVEKPFLTGSAEAARAWGVESQIFLNDIIQTEQQGLIRTWYRDTERGFSTARRQSADDLIEYGYDMEFNLNKKNIIKSKVTHSESGANRTDDVYILSYGRQFGSGDQLSAEYRFEEQEDLGAGSNEKGQLVGIKYSKRITPRWDIYAKGQLTLDEEGGYEDNDRATLGTTFKISRKWEGLAEYGTGDRGDSALAGLGYNIDDGHKVYANYDQSVDTVSTSENSAFTIGQKKRFSKGLSAYTENQFAETNDQAGINQLYGLDYRLDKLWTVGASYQEGDLEDSNTGLLTEKKALSGTLIFSKDKKITISSKASFVRNRGGENFDQILLTNSINYKLNRATTMLIEGDWSRTEDPNLAIPLARFIESNLGFAYRPVSNDRFNFLGKYTYLYDLDSQAQENARNDQRVNIFSMEGAYDLNRRWELGSRIAYKVGQERVVRGTGPWIDTTLTFGQLRARYHLIKKWDALIEYRMVHLKETEDFQNGALLGVDYHLGGNLKLGVGFNFTNFNDDLTNFNFNSYGWFINIVGKL